jgi:hypothetical protein
MQAPPPEAPFADKMAYYRTQHTSKGVNVTHLIGTPIITLGLPLVFAKPKLGLPMFVGGWTFQILGHKLFEKNMPSTHKGWITYQLTGMIHVCETYGEMLARRSQRKAAKHAHVVASNGNGNGNGVVTEMDLSAVAA